MKKFKIQKNIKGFTLSEVLITLGIIGVVAAITIPTLMNKTNNLQYFSAFKRIYSDLSQAAELIKLDNGGSLSGGLGTDSDGMVGIFGTKLSYIKQCATNDGGCWHAGTTTWHTLNGGNGWEDRGIRPSAILKNGTYIMFSLDSPDCSATGWSIHNFCGWVSFDTNGAKPPNKSGIDIFDLYITINGIGLRGSNDNVADWNTYCSITSGDTYNGVGCAARIMSENGINYLQ